MKAELLVANLEVFIGTLLIAGGGLLATMGWDARSTATQKKAMIRAVSAELMINLNIFVDSKFTERDEKQLAKFVVFPRMQTSVLKGSIAGGLFVGEKDRMYLTRAMGLVELLEAFNKRLTITEDKTSGNSNATLKFRKEIRDGKFRKSVGSKLKKFGEVLISEYGLKREDTFFVELDD